jgi:glycine oxidase
MRDNILIVGGGIAGICLAKQFNDEGIEVSIVDRGKNFSSHVAAGIINPIGFRRMTKSWRADELLPYALSFYESIEKETGYSFLEHIKMRRLISSKEEKSLWQQRLEDAGFRSFLETPCEHAIPNVKTPFGSGMLKRVFLINAKELFTGFQHWFSEKHNWIKEEFDFHQLNKESAEYKKIPYSAIVFCQGADNPDNPLFSEVPVQTTKGQLMNIRCTALPVDEALNRKCFVLPCGEQRYKVGATYEWKNRDVKPDDSGKEKLTNMFQHITDSSFEVLTQSAGIRPTTPDRRPFLGRHKLHHNLFFFNGLGSRGYLLAPLLSLEMKQFVLNGKEPHPELQLYRFQKTV